MAKRGEITIQRKPPVIRAIGRAEILPMETVTGDDFELMAAQVGRAHGWAKVPRQINRDMEIRATDGALLRVRHCWWSWRHNAWLIEFEYVKEERRASTPVEPEAPPPSIPARADDDHPG